MKATFIGHRNIENSEKLHERIKSTVLELLKKGVDTFLFGSNSEFDTVCLEAVSGIKVSHPNIRRIYVRSSFCHISRDYEKYLTELYDETYFPSQVERSGAACYVERNAVMIDEADVCVFYYDENYTPPANRKKTAKASSKKPKSGTNVAYHYALSKNKTIINLFGS